MAKFKAGEKSPGKTFAPGKSGNPGGRPKTIAEVQAIAREHTVEAIKSLVDVMANSDSDAARVTAADKVLERGWGKAPTIVNGDENGGPVKARIQIEFVRAGES